MKDITIIVPVHEASKEIASMLESALNSAPNDVNIIVSLPKGVDIVQYTSKEFGKNTVLVNDTEETSFQALVNVAVERVETKWFSILEFDDEYTSIWFDEVEKYIEYYPEVSVFMPFEDIIDANSKNYSYCGNCEAWASSFSNEIGYLDNECLQNYFTFFLTGSVFNTSDWKEMRGLKERVKYTFWYEFLLRITNKGKKVYTVPKVGYLHTINRKNSLMDIANNTVSQDEMKWWFDLSKKDSFFLDEKDDSYYVYKKKDKEE